MINPDGSVSIAVINAMNVRFNMPIDLDFYANICYMSRSRFVHFFKEKMGESPYSYQLKIRIEHAKEILSATDCSIGECAATVGFNDPSYFSRIFRKITGQTPPQYRTALQIR